MKIFTLSFLCILLALLACDKGPETIAEDTVFYNGKIYTVNPTQPWAQAVYVEEGIIKFVGSDEDAENMASENAQFINLRGAVMLPGIHDVHIHPMEASSENFKFILDGEEEDPENYASVIANAMQDNPGNGWLLGWGHYLETVLGATRSPIAILDDIAPNRPLAIMEQTSHSIWCNSKALELAGITTNSSNPTGGIIMRDASGEPNGILIDNAGNILIDLALAPTSATAENDYRGLIEYGLPELAKHGITSICDARTYWKRNHHETWKRIADEGKLTARVNLGLWAYPAEDDATQLAMLKSLYQNNASSLLKINQIKLYSDGIVHNTTAAMQFDYLVDYFEEPTNNGLNYFSQQRIADYIAELEPMGFDFHIHALGNRGITESLNAIEQSGTSNGRHRLTHVEFVDPADYPRFAQLNVTADAQVVGDFTNPDHWHDNDYLIGAAQAENIIPIKSLKDANARLTLSSDWDVSSLNPFVGIQNAVTRAPQDISLEEAIKAYTINAAYVMRQEDKVGSIEVNKEADLIILDSDIFEIPVTQIGQTQVLDTYLQGKKVY